jgi:hypothetical protein
VVDGRIGPKEPRSTVLSKEEEALIVAFRRHTLLPLDDCLYAPQVTMPHLTRSSLLLQSQIPERRGHPWLAALSGVRRQSRTNSHGSLTTSAIRQHLDPILLATTEIANMVFRRDKRFFADQDGGGSHCIKRRRQLRRTKGALGSK